MKKIFSLLLAILLVASLAACKEDEGPNTDLDKYKQEEEIITNEILESGAIIHFEAVDSETVTVTKYEAEDTPHVVTIPEKLNGKTVVAISDEAFRSHSNIKSVVIPSTVTKIGAFAFAGCTNLMSVEIPASVTDMGDGIFYQCEKLTAVSFGANSKLETIPASAFSGCIFLKTMDIPAHVKTVKIGAFFNCSSLERLTVAEGVVTLEAQAFQNCTALKKVTLPATLETIGEFNFTGAPSLYRENVIAPAGSPAEAYAVSLDLPSRLG